MEKLVIAPGDIFVLTVEAHLTEERRDRLSQQLAKVFKVHQANIVVLTGGMRLGVVNTTSIQADPAPQKPGDALHIPV